MTRKSVITVVVGLIVIGLLATSAFFYSKNNAEDKQANTILDKDLTSVGKQAAQELKKNKDVTRVTGVNCILTTQGGSDVDPSGKEKNGFGGSSKAKGVVALQFHHAKGKSDVVKSRVTPGTCIVIYPLDEQGHIDMERKNTDNGYAVIGYRDTSNVKKLPVFSSRDGKVLDKKYDLVNDELK